MSESVRVTPESLLPLACKILGRLEPDQSRWMTWLETPELHSPSQADAVVQAAARLKQAAASHEKVIVAGDYDADGILGTAILTGALRRQGIETGFYIPDRIREGYGLQEKTVRLAHEKGYSLLVTVDNGVRAEEALACAADLGMDVIVTDHHQFETPPQAAWFVHPALMEPEFSTLCGAAVACELLRHTGWATDYELLLAGVASVGDQMAVTGQTRALIFQALEQLKTDCDPHIRLLAQGIPENETDLSFQVIPKINALGRLSDLANANNAVRFFLTDDFRHISSLAQGICQINDRRREMSGRMVQEAQSRVRPGSTVIFLEDPTWHEGIIGLAAGSLCETTGRPVILAARGQSGLKCSMRSPEGVDCMDLLKGFDRFVTLGGHSRAAGFSLDLKDRDDFEAYLKTVTVPHAQKADPLDVKAADLTIPAIRQLDALRPFGTGFELPELRIQDPAVAFVRDLSAGRHRRYVMENGLEAMRFNQPDSEKALSPDQIRWLTGKPSVNVWMQTARPQLILSAVGTSQE